MGELLRMRDLLEEGIVVEVDGGKGKKFLKERLFNEILVE